MTISTLTQSDIYKYYWIFAQKRQEIFFSRYNGFDEILINDSILKKYKFTNTYRASDRVSQYLIKEIIYKGSQEINELFFRIILFKLFNKIETWEYLNSIFPTICLSCFDVEKFSTALSNYRVIGNTVYSAAYIMPSYAGDKRYKEKHISHLNLLKKMINDDLPQKIANAKSLRDVFNHLLAYPGLGKFLAFQYTIDLNYSNIINFDENDFVVAGPGAINGIRKCFADIGRYSFEDVIKYMVDNQDREFQKYGLAFKTLWGRDLKLIDCQNIFCEVDKYTRAAFPEYSAITGRTRIKQQYKRNLEPIDYFYPPRWGINTKMKREF
ncbi:nucleotide kinase domain-containing protein [Geovibrio ferrireducens]|uniref:nucleotide kinase domain-containing protein n=1 Tax=Geovibrio ferrireducens TaxID=46201 RepID=UPI002246753E|nr:nucleotide kinase domain-containing protein [Geovibrio ferrireducens]